ncbi:MAG: glutaredoxin family protein [Burkholderiaceae bacterium]
MNQFRLNTNVTSDFLAQIEPELRSIIHARLLDIQKRFSYPKISRALLEIARLLSLLGLAAMLWHVTANWSLRSLASALGYILFFTLILVLAWNPKSLAQRRFPQYWSWLAKRRTRGMLKRATRLAPYISDYEFRGDLATCYRTKDDKSTCAWMRRMSGCRIDSRGFTLLYKKEKSLHPYAIILHDSSMELESYLEGLGIKAIEYPAASDGNSAANQSAHDVHSSAKSNVRPIICAAFLIAVMYAAISWGPIVYFKPSHDARNIEIFTTDWCGYCVQLRGFLRANNIPFRETDIEHSVRGDLARIGLASNGSYVRGVPFLTIGPHVIYGLNNIEIEKAVSDLGYAVVTPFKGAATSPPATSRTNR